MVDSLQSLQQMQVHLAAQAESVSIRGAGAASFLFAKHSGRAVEISSDEGMCGSKSGSSTTTRIRRLVLRPGFKASKKPWVWHLPGC